jgi:hypothetical protein
MTLALSFPYLLYSINLPFFTSVTDYTALYDGVSTYQQQMKAELYANGPVVATFKVYSDFVQYSSGVYVHTGGIFKGGHAVRVLGWGSQLVNGVQVNTYQENNVRLLIHTFLRCPTGWWPTRGARAGACKALSASAGAPTSWASRTTSTLAHPAFENDK